GASLAALLNRIVARVGRQLRATQGLADPAPEAVGQAGHDDRSVLGRESAVRHEIRVLGALRLRVLATEPGQLGNVAEHADQSVHQAYVDVAALAGRVPLVQRGKDGDGAVDAADEIAERNSELRRLLAGFAVYAQGARHGLEHDV